MASKYVIIFGPVQDGVKLREGETRMKGGVAFLLDSAKKTDEQAIRRYNKIKKDFLDRAQIVHLCKIIR
jgi:U3 small nucleolar ribonucleoprotein component